MQGDKRGLMSRKGQSLIFEQVLLFGISVAIFLIFFSIFNIYQVVYIQQGNFNHLDEAKEWVSANILKVAEKNATTFLIIPIPRLLGEAVYEVKLESKGLTLTNILTNEKKFSNLYLLNQTHSMNGTVNSIKGKITIKKEGNQIIIV